MSGYAGGRVRNPSYKEVCAGTTGHAEVVQVTFDPTAISFREILEVFFTIHDPTTLNRQGADVGTQYRSAIFYHSPEQKATAEQVIREIDAAKIWPAPIVTQVAPFASSTRRRTITRSTSRATRRRATAASSSRRRLRSSGSST